MHKCKIPPDSGFLGSNTLHMVCTHQLKVFLVIHALKRILTLHKSSKNICILIFKIPYIFLHYVRVVPYIMHEGMQNIA